MHRGHRIVTLSGGMPANSRSVWVYADTGEPVSANPNRDCGHCGLANTPEGHDGCLGTLPGVMNACCGHGTGEAYVQFPPGNVTVYGAEGLKVIEVLKREREARTLAVKLAALAEAYRDDWAIDPYASGREKRWKAISEACDALPADWEQTIEKWRDEA